MNQRFTHPEFPLHAAVKLPSSHVHVGLAPSKMQERDSKQVHCTSSADLQTLALAPQEPPNTTNQVSPTPHGGEDSSHFAMFQGCFLNPGSRVVHKFLDVLLP